MDFQSTAPLSANDRTFGCKRQVVFLKRLDVCANQQVLLTTMLWPTITNGQSCVIVEVKG